MSYNTRGVRMNRPNYGNSPSANSNFNQSPQSGYHQNQNTSCTQPAYSTPTNYGQNKPNYPQTTPNQQPKAQQQAPPAQQAPLPQPPAPPVLKESPASVPAAQPQQPPPEPKQETDEKGSESAMDTSEDAPSSTPRGPKFRPWNKRGAAGKISRKMKKRRQNARLRNLLAPKNAMMVLHELHPELKMAVSEQVNAANQVAYTVEIEVEGKIFRGHGMSKMSAKQVASENALKAVLLEKLEQNNLKINPDNTLSSEGNAAGGAADGATPQPAAQQDVPMKEEGAAAGSPPQEGEDGAQPAHRTGRRPVEDDVPWGSLASFALFKLFSEWQSQGFQLPPSGLPPVFHKVGGVPSVAPLFMTPQHHNLLQSSLPVFPPSQAAGSKKIPEDANKKHPVQLLNQIRPGSQYSESREGTPPNLTFKFTVMIDGQVFNGVGSNKRDAKKECAKHALEALGVKYD